MSGDFSLYIHIPFCTKKCPYCHFFVIRENEEQKERLLDAILLDWDQWKEKFQDHTLTSIYFGGGTPSLLGASRISKILDAIGTAQEITLETNPETLIKELAEEYRKIGINRLSIGVQSFDDALLKTLGRTHLAADAKNAVKNAATAGFKNITIDLMYDLPGQTLSQWEESLNTAAELPITHLSLYNLTIEAGTPFFRKRKALKKACPSESISREMYEKAVQTMCQAGFTQYEISAFSKPGFESIHNQGYWEGRPYLGLGPSAHSFIDLKRFRAIPNLPKYCEKIETSLSPIDEEETLTLEKRRTEALTLRLRMLKGCDLNGLESEFGKLEKESLESIEQLMERGLLERKESILRLTQEGSLFYDTVAVALI